MSQPSITPQEAGKLLETTLLLISQQNLAEKQRHRLSEVTLSPLSPSTAIKSQDKYKMGFIKLETPRKMSETIDFQSMKNDTRCKDSQILKQDMKKIDSFFQNLDKKEEIQMKTSTKKKKVDENASEGQAKSQKLNRQHFLYNLNERQQKNQQIDEQVGNTIYLESQIKDLKRDLQINSKGKLCKNQQIDKITGIVMAYHLYCKNDEKCLYECTLQYKGIKQGNRIYKLIRGCENHLVTCLQHEEELIFMRTSKRIDELEPNIKAMLIENDNLKPKEIMQRLAVIEGESDYKFLTKGLHSKQYQKAVKKYFDNLIYKIRGDLKVSSVRN